MSVDLVVTALDLDRFRAAQGGQDEGLLRQILAAKEADIAHHDEYFRDWVEPGRYQPLGVAIRQIIYGTIDDGFEPLFQFEHAAAAIAEVIGETLDSQVLMEVKEDFWKEVNTVIRGCRKVTMIRAALWPTLDDLVSRGPLLEIPLARVRLGTGHLTGEEVRNANAVIPEHVHVPPGTAKRLTWPDQAQEAVQVYRDWIYTAADLGVGLFFHH